MENALSLSVQQQKITKARTIINHYAFVNASSEKQISMMRQLVAKGLSLSDLEMLVKETNKQDLLVLYEETFESRAETAFPKKVMDRTWSKIPDIDILILANLSNQDLGQSCKTSSYVAKLCRNPNLWRKKIAIDFPLRGNLQYIYYEPYRKMYDDNPKELYKTISKRSKIVGLAELFPEIYKLMHESKDYLPAKTIDSLIKPKLHMLPLLRGDVLVDISSVYRNEGKYLWDGLHVSELGNEHSIQEYGYATKEFKFPEFPLDHFLDSIDNGDGGTVIFLSPGAFQELKDNFEPVDQVADRPDMGGHFTLIATSVVSDRHESYKINFINEMLEDIRSYEKDEYLQKMAREILKRNYLVTYPNEMKVIDGVKTVKALLQ